MKRSSSDHIENSCWSIAQRTRGFDSRLLRVLVSATDVKPAAVGTAGRSIAFFPSEKVVKPTETACNFSPPDPTAPKADAPTQPLPLPCRRGSQRGRVDSRYLTASPIDRSIGTRPDAEREPSCWRVALHVRYVIRSNPLVSISWLPACFRFEPSS